MRCKTYALETTLIEEVAQDFADINKLSLFFALSQKVLPRWNTLENVEKGYLLPCSILVIICNDNAFSKTFFSLDKHR